MPRIMGLGKALKVCVVLLILAVALCMSAGAITQMPMMGPAATACMALVVFFVAVGAAAPRRSVVALTWLKRELPSGPAPSGPEQRARDPIALCALLI